MPSFTDRIQHAWNAFRGRDHPVQEDYGVSAYYRPDRRRIISTGNDKSIVTSIINRISVDAASIEVFHARVDENEQYIGRIKSGLNECLTVEANSDQTGVAFMTDLYRTILGEGCAVVAPIETTIDPSKSANYDIRSIRVGTVKEWYPQHVKIFVYNEKTGTKEEIVVPKHIVSIIENPFYDIMNEQNSTLQRLVRKLSLLDSIDEQTSAGKLDMIIQLPYVIKSKARQEQAERRRKEIESQLRNSKYGIAYTDGTEKITQLNRPLENNLLTQIEYLTNQLYSQLGITPEILNGTANEETMLNYYSRTIEPLLEAVTKEFKRKFLTKTARTQGQSILFIRNPFKLVTLGKLAEIVNSFTQNEILSSNEIRGIIGYKPSSDQRANMLLNKNINPAELEAAYGQGALPGVEEEDYPYEEEAPEMDYGGNLDA